MRISVFFNNLFLLEGLSQISSTKKAMMLASKPWLMMIGSNTKNLSWSRKKR